ncbi:ClpP family protease [Corynebacterium spheniscorum]|uniref:ATP-dependent Clp protease proteolytic subunit n=1 Tax=Corynebacterium spheniscorum TaxID=185761 RepID=A0A1I2RAH0_9CORY|nr:ATP-dependent Clp protease proteolytic subunit [Corynebacterium spheniscorum]KAA8722615.1 ATP-dependent Clp protease proteolytic subunit [Corynebacterium spheniscorum]SFG37684.1 Clp protease [Corynebacterium spheniscorum]
MLNTVYKPSANDAEDSPQTTPAPTPPIEALIQQGLFDGRTVTLFGEVTSEQCQSICGQMLAGMMVYDLIKVLDAPVRTVALGLATSMDQFLLSAGTKGPHWVFPSARVMMHQPSSGIDGSAEDVRIQVELHRLTRKHFEEKQAKNTGQSIETIHRHSEHDRWFNAHEAVDYELADHVVSSWDQVKVLKMKTPETPKP